MTSKLTLWEPSPAEIIPADATTPTQITKCAVQLSVRDQRQIARALEEQHYEMGVNYLWVKSMTALKRELGTLGVEFLGEMLGRTEVDEDDDVQDLLSDKEALRLAEELGMISSTEALRLRHTQETVAHFAKNDLGEGIDPGDEMDEADAARALKSCIKNILGRPRIEVAQRFVEFRKALLEEPLTSDSTTVELLGGSPYFFKKLSINILLSAIKSATGAALEISLGNLNTVLPVLWPGVRDAERWQIGHTYAEVYAQGKSVAMQGIKQALLKVKGFDFVPENLRSDTFAKAAEAIIRAHEGLDNFYNEHAPVEALERLGTVVPAPALAVCTSALLSVELGNRYGASFTAAPIAYRILKKYTHDRWEYYLNHCFGSDIRVLNKLDEQKPQRRWFSLVEECDFDLLNIKDKAIKGLIDAADSKDVSKFENYLSKVLAKYYGRRQIS